MELQFTKMQAYGNDYVYVNAISQEIGDPQALARRVSERHFGIGSDGLVLICPSRRGEFRMRMFNPDGTEGEMCGNALRSLSKYVYDHGLTQKTEFEIETLGGMQHVWLQTEGGRAVNITADIGQPHLAASAVPVNTPLEQFVNQPVEVLDRTFSITALSWGNPHCVMFLDDTASLDVAKYGPAIEHMTALFPNKINVTSPRRSLRTTSRSGSGSGGRGRPSAVEPAAARRRWPPPCWDTPTAGSRWNRSAVSSRWTGGSRTAMSA